MWAPHLWEPWFYEGKGDFKPVQSFKGIHYGQAERFEKSAFWERPKNLFEQDCERSAAMCPQNMTHSDDWLYDLDYGNGWKNRSYTEDCLTLEIYGPIGQSS